MRNLEQYGQAGEYYTVKTQKKEVVNIGDVSISGNWEIIKQSKKLVKEDEKTLFITNREYFNDP